MSNTRTNRTGSIVAFILSGLLLAIASALFLNRQAVLDRLTVWSFEPSSAVASIEKNVNFTDKGKFIFYATKPSLEKQDDFNKKCPRQEAGNPILGCYTATDQIYIYDLTNEQLAGMEEVTAAHEMLHAAWFRTSKEDQEKLKIELEAAYEKLNDDELTKRMAYYQRTEPGEYINELHSILGTEIASLGEPLESYYAQFFDRATVLKLHGQYNDLYKTLYTRADDLYAKLESLSSSIQTRMKEYEAAVNQYSADVDSFNNRADNGGFTTMNQFYNERASLIARSNTLESARQSINTDINTYNAYYAEYEDIAKQIEILNKSIDSFNQIDEAPSV